MELIKPGRQFDFMGKAPYFIAFSLFLSVVGIVSILYPGIRWGTDFSGGTEIEVEMLAAVEAADVRAAVESAGFAAPDVVAVGTGKAQPRFLIRVQEVSALSSEQQAETQGKLCLTEEGAAAPSGCPENARATEVRFSPGGEKISVRYAIEPDLNVVRTQIQTVAGIELKGGADGIQLVSKRDNKVEIYLKSKGDALMDGLRAKLGADKVPEAALRVEWIGPKAGKQLRDSALKSVVISVLLIIAYLVFRFDFRFAPGAIVALLHDILGALAFVVLTNREFNIQTVAALLTVSGYSINDTVIVYDRIRENLTKHRDLSFAQVVNLSASEVFSRTIVTSLTSGLSIMAFVIWGTGPLKDFAAVMLVGIGLGTYSSIYVAAPLTEYFDRRVLGSRASRPRILVKERQAKRADAVV